MHGIQVQYYMPRPFCSSVILGHYVKTYINPFRKVEYEKSLIFFANAWLYLGDDIR